MDTLTALPVGCGDAFLFQRIDGQSVLVDGGKARGKFPGMIAEYGVTACLHIDIVVCTHADADHSLGILGLVESGTTMESRPVSCGELWLPGRWLDRIDDLVNQPGEFLDELASDVVKAESGEIHGFRQRALVDAGHSPDLPEAKVDLGGDERFPSGELRVPGVAGLDRKPIVDSLGAAAALATRRLLTVHARPVVAHSPDRLDVWRAAVLTAERIRAIAVAAERANIPVRWFDVAEAARLQKLGPGRSGLLQPLNSIQLRSRPNRRTTALRYIGLSASNRESLVFGGYSVSRACGVLFAADSDLRGCGFSAFRPTSIVVTAPHHGSEANRRAYEIVSNRFSGAPLWVRSDSRSKSRPGCSYLAVDQHRRACTRCRGLPDSEQAVRVHAGSRGWRFGSDVQCCTCVPKQADDSSADSKEWR